MAGSGQKYLESVPQYEDRRTQYVEEGGQFFNVAGRMSQPLTSTNNKQMMTTTYPALLSTLRHASAKVVVVVS
jgi:hypothetical protein